MLFLLMTNPLFAWFTHNFLHILEFFCSDSGGEYIYLMLFTSFYLSLEGTLAQLSCHGAHAQNGIAE